MNDNAPSDAPTRVLLRRGDGMFYVREGAWTVDRQMARDFEEASRALVVARTVHADRLEIVVRDGEGESIVLVNG